MKKKNFCRIIIAAVALGSAPFATAATAVIDFSANTNAQNSVLISGQLTLDVQLGGQTVFDPAVLSASIFVGDTEYSNSLGEPIGSLFIRNNFGNGSAFSDTFVIEVELTSTDGNFGFFGFVLQDSTAEIFSNERFPLFDFDLSQFDEFGTNQDLGSYLLALSVGPIGSNFATLESLTYTVVPLPAGAWLLLSALAACGALRRSSHKNVMSGINH